MLSRNIHGLRLLLAVLVLMSSCAGLKSNDRNDGGQDSASDQRNGGGSSDGNLKNESRFGDTETSSVPVPINGVLLTAANFGKVIVKVKTEYVGGEIRHLITAMAANLQGQVFPGKAEGIETAFSLLESGADVLGEISSYNGIEVVGFQWRNKPDSTSTVTEYTAKLIVTDKKGSSVEKRGSGLSDFIATLFVTSAGYRGIDLNGLSGADATCTAQAQSGSLTSVLDSTGKHWVAVMGDRNNDGKSRVPKGDSLIVRNSMGHLLKVGGDPFFAAGSWPQGRLFAHFLDHNGTDVSTYHPDTQAGNIGYQVWTGFSNLGESAGPALDCNQWGQLGPSSETSATVGSLQEHGISGKTWFGTKRLQDMNSYEETCTSAANRRPMVCILTPNP